MKPEKPRGGGLTWRRQGVLASTKIQWDTYQGDIGLWHSSDIQEIPAPIAAPQNENLMSINSKAKIMSDVETTSLGNTCLY